MQTEREREDMLKGEQDRVHREARWGFERESEGGKRERGKRERETYRGDRERKI
jgi:hypothetical protein